MANQVLSHFTEVPRGYVEAPVGCLLCGYVGHIAVAAEANDDGSASRSTHFRR